MDIGSPRQPVGGTERLEILDIIRGFALLGVLLMNIEYFQRPLQAVLLGMDATPAGLDGTVTWFVFTFVQGKFYTLFSLLFGLGFVVFLDRALQRGAGAQRLFTRRLALLGLIGLVHATAIWSGDILLLYAVLGFLLLPFAHTSASRLWSWGIALYFVPTVLFWLAALSLNLALHYSSNAVGILAGLEADRVALLADVARGERIYAQGSWLEATRWRLYELAFLYSQSLFFAPTVLGMFLVGAALGRAGVCVDPATHAGLFRRMALLGFAVGVPSAVAWGLFGAELQMTYPTVQTAVLMTLAAIASITLCLAYLASVILLWLRGAAWLRALAPVGRMALSNYLTHSLVFTLLFYGYGAGLYGEFGRATTTLFALVLFALQVLVSRWWLGRYRYGPMEWLWRWFTYGRRPALRINAHGPAGVA
jgi:uncharacterized protein